MGYTIRWEEAQPGSFPRVRREVLLGEWVAKGDRVSIRLPAWVNPFLAERDQEEARGEALKKLVGLLEGSNS